MNCPDCGSSSVSVEVGPAGTGRLVHLVVRAEETDSIDLVRSCWTCGWRETRVVAVDSGTVEPGDQQVAAREQLLNELLEAASTLNSAELLIEGAVEAGVFGGKCDALREFAREYFADPENERIAAAVALYDREVITLGDAARLADVDRWTMRDILHEHGSELRIGLADKADAAYEAEAATELVFANGNADGQSATDGDGSASG